jgi:hypothetical protein
LLAERAIWRFAVSSNKAIGTNYIRLLSDKLRCGLGSRCTIKLLEYSP